MVDENEGSETTEPEPEPEPEASAGPDVTADGAGLTVTDALVLATAGIPLFHGIVTSPLVRSALERLAPLPAPPPPRALEATSFIAGRAVLAASPPLDVAAVAAGHAGLLLVLLAYVRLRRVPPRSLGLARRRDDVAFTLRAGAFLAIGLALALGIAGAIAARRDRGLPLRLAVEAATVPLLETWPGAVLLALVMVVLAPLAEEALFRGAIYRGLRSRLDAPWAAILQATAFAAWHFPLSARPSLELPMRPEAHVVQYAFALLAAWIVERRGTIFPAVALHAAGNAAALALMAIATNRPEVALRFFGG